MMDIKKIERYHCHLCDYITEGKSQIEFIKKSGKCPACSNGKPMSWEHRTEVEGIHATVPSNLESYKQPKH